MSDGSEHISRRSFIKSSAVGASFLVSGSLAKSSAAKTSAATLRLGGPVFEEFDDPDSWVKALKALRYSAAYCPVEADESDDVVRAYEEAAKKANIVIAEVGVWNNPLDPDEKKRKAAFKRCCRL